MNEFHKHLVINHFPVIGIFFAIFVLLIGILVRADGIKRVAFILFILVAIFVIPTNESGEHAEHAITKSMGFDENSIEKHEDAAKFAFWTSIITGILSIIAFVASYKEHDLRGVLAIIVLLVSMVAVFYLWQTSESGGKIRHTEIETQSE